MGKEAARGSDEKTAEQAEKALESESVSKLGSEIQKVVPEATVISATLLRTQDVASAAAQDRVQSEDSKDGITPTVPVILVIAGVATIGGGYYVQQVESRRRADGKHLIGDQ